MNYKGLLKNVLGLALILSLGIYVSSCSEDELPMPELTLVINGVDGFAVDIATEASNATTWSWDYGDGNVSETVGGHIYTYAERGDFTIKCTVTGEGGSLVKTVDVHIATVEELLTAHTWVMSKTGTNGLGYRITKDLLLDMPVADVLGAIDAFQDPATDLPYDYNEEYNDEYTFNANGTYSVDYINTNILIGWIYGGLNYGDADYRGTCRYVGINVVTTAALTDAKWTLHENENLDLETVYAPDPNNPSSGGIGETVNFESIDYITFENGGFIGMKDLTTTAIINSISTEELSVTLFYHGYEGNPASDGGLYARPSFLVKMTFEAK